MIFYVAMPFGVQCHRVSSVAKSVPETLVPKTVFYPKKVAIEVQAMLEESWSKGGQAFVAWWRRADQPMGFWVETSAEMIRVYVVPRVNLFAPSRWATEPSA